MSADPTDAELAGFNTLANVMTWAGMLGDPADNATAPGSLIAGMGAVPTTHPRAVGGIPTPDFGILIDNWGIPQPDQAGVAQPALAPTPIQRAQALLFGRACRIRAGFQQTLAAAAAAAVKAPPATPPTTLSDRVKLSEVTNQADTREVARLTPTELDTCYKNYKQTYEEYPSEDDEASAEQLAAYAFLLKNDEQYADFAIFGPQAIRLMRKLRMRGMNFSTGGELVPVEIGGPPSYHLWSKCFACLRTCLISHKAVPLGALEAYKSHICDYHDRYGKECWHLIYQSDVRMRQEQMERTRRRLSDEHAVATTSGHTTKFEPSRPFAMVYAEATKETSWWKKEVEDPCMLLLTKTAKLSNLLGEDARIESEHQRGASSVADGGLFPGGGPRGNTRVRAGTGGSGSDNPPPPKDRKKHHNLNAEGVYATNRSNIACCPEFQHSACSRTVGANGRCSGGCHQCNRCLSKDHGADGCTKDPPSPIRPGKGRGKGKGKGGGKGGGGGYRQQY
jgi:hypothetical protein